MRDQAVRLRARSRTAEIEGEDATEAGFTLIELMVVLLIIAVLLAIAIPTFLGVTNSGNDRAAQSNLTNALTEGKTLYGITGAYADSTGTAYSGSDFASQAPEFQWNYNSACPSSIGNCVSALIFNVASATDSEGLSLAVNDTKTNTCWYVFDLEAQPGVAPIPTEFSALGVFYGQQSPIPSGGCQALNPATDVTTPGISFASGQGQSYGTAVAVS